MSIRILNLTAAIALLAAFTTGCETEQRVISTSFGLPGEESAASADDDRDEGGFFENLFKSSSSRGGDGDGEWAIALGRVTGEGHADRAERIGERIAGAAGAEDVWTSPDGDGTMIYYGRYDARNDPIARADLRRWRGLHASGKMRLPILMLTPIENRSATGDSDISQYALENVASQGKYTYQVGMYDEDYGDDFREAAEEAVRVYRDDGWEAYYWHGPVSSIITIGVFSEEARDPEKKTPEALRVEALAREFPHNLLNGRTIRMTPPGGDPYDAPTFLVSMPR